MTTVVLILLCLAIAGRELYLAFERKRSPGDRIAAAEMAAIRARVTALESELEEAQSALQAALPASPHTTEVAALPLPAGDAAGPDEEGAGPNGESAPGFFDDPDESTSVRILWSRDSAAPNGGDTGAPQPAGVPAALGEARRDLERLWAAVEERLDGIGPDLARYEEALRVTDTRVRSLIEQINERVLPEINERLAEQHDATDRLAAEVARLRRHLRRRLDEAAESSLGGDPVDVVRGLVGGEIPAADRVALTEAYERCAAAHGLYVELVEAGGDKAPWFVRYYLSGISPRELERGFLEAVSALRSGAGSGELRSLLDVLYHLEEGMAQLGPLLVVRTPGRLLYGVRPLADLLRREPPAATVKDLQALADRLLELPVTRRCDLSAWQPRPLSA